MILSSMHVWIAFDRKDDVDSDASNGGGVSVIFVKEKLKDVKRWWKIKMSVDADANYSSWILSFKNGF